MANAQNVATLAQIKEDLEGVQAVWVVDYRGLTVKESQQLRRDVRAAGGVMKVYKNTLVKRALADMELASMDEILEGPSAFVFAKNDPVAPAKALKDFAKGNENLQLKGGIMDGEFQDAAAFEQIASLPSRDELLGGIACSLTAVASQLAIAFGQMSEKDAEQEAA
ncbi:MAG: 50S ribosomal protein L10 [Coriobacteriia bacterium]|nr:50S ribosomal protein L10 [Coriobacteriia bacterium]